VVRVERELERWGAWMKRRRPRPRLEEVDADLLVSYLQARGAFRSKATVASAMSVMRGMGEFLVGEGLWPSNPLRWMRGPRIEARARVPRRIGAPEMEALWRSAAEQRSGYQRQLWTALLGVLYGTGLRRGELVRLDLVSWDAAGGTLGIDGRKTGRARRVAVPPLAEACLESYLPHRHNQLERTGATAESALFVSARGGRLSGESVSTGLTRLACRAGLAGVTLHAFRHTCASDLLEAGVHLASVQRVLGHEWIGTTCRYLQVADRQRHAAMTRHPINEWIGGVA
jgi:integrase/recombinase XerD